MDGTKVSYTFILVCLLLVLSSCVVTKVGVSSKQSGADYAITADEEKRKDSTSVQVIDLSYTQALEVAIEVATEAFNGAVQVSPDHSRIYSTNSSRWAGDISVEIEPLLLRDNSSEQTGIAFKIECTGIGFNASSGPGYGANDFLEQLDKYVEDNALDYITFNDYKILDDKGVIVFAPASIPVSMVGYIKYLDDKDHLGEFEGVWSTSDNRYTLGVYHDAKDIQHHYKAFIISSTAANWRPGEIKFKFSRLSRGKVATGVMHLKNGAEVGTTWNVEHDIISTAIPINNVAVALIKSYPSDAEEVFYATGVGTAWLVHKDNVFVTNAHVVRHAKKINIGPKGQTVPARVLLIDNRTDLALLQCEGAVKGLGKQLPLSGEFLPNGSVVTVIGYPRAFDLGDQARVTEGIISAQSGIKKDITRYQISAPLNPGNSGGPVIASDGSVVGVVVEKLYDGEVTNFAIKSTYVESLIKQLGIAIPKLTESISGLSHEQIFSKYQHSVYPVWTE